jgi:hypothetical protein
MRAIALALLLIVPFGPPLGAQEPAPGEPPSAVIRSGNETLAETGTSAPVQGEREVRGNAPAEPGPVPLIATAPAEAEPATAPVLDEAFWRSVLAGVLVAVISTLILRAVL